MNICEGIDNIIDEAFSLLDIGETPHYTHKKSCVRLSKGALPGFDADKLLNSMLSRLEKNWEKSPRRQRIGPSKENWRWEKKLDISVENKSLEKTLEKTIARLKDEWVNQIPTASGLWGEYSDKQRNVDLAQQIERDRYKLIELKVDSNTPLHAAVEIIQYAVFYLFTRKHYPKRLQESQKLLQAKTIHLCVLAPQPYYIGYYLGWMVPPLNTAFADFLSEHNLRIQMDFDFLWFPQAFDWPCSDEESLKALSDISQVRWDEHYAT